VIDDMRQGYREIVAHVKSLGELVAPRHEATRELTAAHIILTNPADALPVGVGRKVNTGIAAAEAAQLIAGQQNPELMLRISPNFKQYMDGGTFHGAYGTRMQGQFWTIIRRLRDDPYTRRAYISFWDPSKDLEDGYHNYPCTTSIQFLIRNGKLDAFVNMRANDVWHGFAYDVFQFTQLQYTVAGYVGVGVGTYHHYAASLHIYEKDIPAAINMLNEAPSSKKPDLRAQGLTVPGARQLLGGLPPGPCEINHPGDSLDSLHWYTEKLERYLGA
jgi:thymidylate synthase